MLTPFFVLLAVAVAGVAVAVAVGRISGGMAEPTSTVPVRALPDGDVEPADVDQLRFEVALRGYRMQQVDAALDRLRTELARYQEEHARLQAELSTGGEAEVEAEVEAEARDAG